MTFAIIRSDSLSLGFLGEDWVGPQILAHHLLLMATCDLYDKDYVGDKKEERNCKEKHSLLNDKFFLGKIYVKSIQWISVNRDSDNGDFRLFGIQYKLENRLLHKST